MLQQIVHQLDAELERLQSIRNIVAGLQSAPVLTEVTLTEVDLEPQASPEEMPESAPRERGQRRPRSVKTVSMTEKRSEKVKQIIELRALKSSIPAGPVVVSAQSLARERETRAASKATAGSPVSSPETDDAALNALTRSLANRWRVGTDSSPHTR
ncbi:MAG: hypothetical protein ACRYFU_21690 [Janthinobacterium lividum]